jgi:hypothetical protein
MKKFVLIALIIGLVSQVSKGQEDQTLGLNITRPLIAQELKALSSIARESVRDIQEKYHSFKEELEKITQETNTTKQLTQLIFMVESTAQTLVQEWSKIGYQAGELLESLSSLAINETETQKIKDIAQSLKTASRDFDEFRNSVQAKVFPIIEQNLTHIKTLIPEFITPTPEHIPTEPTRESELPTEPTPEPILTEEQPSTELLAPPVEEPQAPTPEAVPTAGVEPTPSEEPMQAEPISEPTPAEQPTVKQVTPQEPESSTTSTGMFPESSSTQITPAIDEDIDDLPGSAPEIAQILNRGKIEGASESELKNLLEKKEKDFDEKFPGPGFLALIGDLNILHAYAKATRDYVNLAKQALEKQDKESVTRLQEKINEIKQKYVNKINEINDRYRSTEWYAFYTQ